MLLYYIRHGDPIYEPDGLTELGHKQAKALSKRLALYGLDEIYSSTSVRAQQTAQPTCDILGKEKILLEWAHEAKAWECFSVRGKDDKYTWAFQNYETVEKFNSPEVLSMGPKWYEHPYFIQTNFQNGVQKINKNADAFLRSLGYKHDRTNNRYEILKKNDKRIALFAHQGFGLAFLSSILDIPYPVYCSRFDLGHSSVTVINFEEWNGFVYPKALQTSNDSHLYKADILTGYHNLIDI